MNVLKIKLFVSSNILIAFEGLYPKIRFSSFFDQWFVCTDSLRAGHKN